MLKKKINSALHNPISKHKCKNGISCFEGLLYKDFFFPFPQLLRYFAILKADNISREYLHSFSANNSEADNTGKTLVSI